MEGEDGILCWHKNKNNNNTDRRHSHEILGVYWVLPTSDTHCVFGGWCLLLKVGSNTPYSDEPCYSVLLLRSNYGVLFTHNFARGTTRVNSLSPSVRFDIVFCPYIPLCILFHETQDRQSDLVDVDVDADVPPSFNRSSIKVSFSSQLTHLQTVDHLPIISHSIFQTDVMISLNAMV